MPAVLAYVAAAVTAAPSGLELEETAVWRDLSLLPILRPGERASLTSSYCRDGCRFDRHSHGEPKFLRITGDEGVLFEDWGAGVVTRMWMTMGQGGVSVPLDADILIRISVDGNLLLEMPLPDFFSGQHAPFLAPMTGDRDISAGGNFSHVPIPYRNHCRISLINAETKRIWYQINHRNEPNPATLDGTGDLSLWRQWLNNPGSNPWETQTQPLAEGDAVLDPGGSVTLFDVQGADTLMTLYLNLPAPVWLPLELSLICDGKERVRMPVADFFAVGAAAQNPPRSLFLGVDDRGWLYSYFPMPFFENMKLELADPSGQLVDSLPFSFEIHGTGQAPHAAAGYFTAIRQEQDPSQPGMPYPLFEVQGRGKWVGLFAELGSVGTKHLAYLEGDEHVFVNGEALPRAHGTGVEDFFGGGFYFRDANHMPQPFGLALHGMTRHVTGGGESATSMYRLMPADAFPFERGIRATLESGPTGNVTMRAKTVAYFYLKDPVEPQTKNAPMKRPNPRVKNHRGEPLLFPDPLFEAYLLTGQWQDTNGDSFPFDLDGNGAISSSEALAVTGLMDCSYQQINDLEGLSHFANLTGLHCRGNDLTELNLTDLLALRHLDLSENPRLARLSLSSPSLETLILVDNPVLTVLDLLNLTSLRRLELHGAGNVGPRFPGGLPAAEAISLAFCGLDHLPQAGWGALTRLELEQVTGLTELNLTQIPSLSHMRLSGNPDLTVVALSQLQGLVSLEITAHPEMDSLQISDTPLLTAATIRANASLRLLSLADIPQLAWLRAERNALTDFQFSNANALSGLDLRENRLTFLPDLSSLPLEWVNLSQNELTAFTNLPPSPRFLDFSVNRFIAPYDPSALPDLYFSDYRQNQLIELAPLASAFHVLTQPAHVLHVENNLLNGQNCPDYQTLLDRAMFSGALFTVQPQWPRFGLWPAYSVLDLVVSGFDPFDCD